MTRDSPKRAVMVCIAAGVMASPAVAEPPGMGFSGGSSDLTAHLSEKLDFRASTEREWARHQTRSSPTYAPVGDELGTGALMDWRFDSEGLRLTGGALHEGERFNHGAAALGQEREPRRLFSNGDGWRPYVGVGWDSSSRRSNQQLDIQLDMGLIFESMGPEGQADGEASLLDQETFLRQEFESFRYTPAISADVEYRF